MDVNFINKFILQPINGTNSHNVAEGRNLEIVLGSSISSPPSFSPSLLMQALLNLYPTCSQSLSVTKINTKASGSRWSRTVIYSLDLEIGEMIISLYTMYLFPKHHPFY